MTNIELLPEQLQKAVMKFEDFVKSGQYAARTQTEKNLKAAKEGIRELLADSEERKHIFREHGMIAKFVPKEVRTTDHRGLIEEILCYIRSEALSQVISFNNKKMEENEVKHMITPYEYEPTYYIRPTLNKHGKSFNNAVKEEFTGADMDYLLNSVKNYTELDAYYQHEYRKCINGFKGMELNKIQTEVGSISRIRNKPDYNIYQIIEELGEDFVLEYGEVKLSKLDEWIDMGALPPNIAKEYQQVIDVRLDFVVMTLEAEQRAMEVFYNKLEQRKRRFSAS